MKIKNTLNIIAGLALLAFAPLTRAQCPQICDSNQNTAYGVSALNSNTTGHNNTASGLEALFANSIGNNNTADGYDALYSNQTGSDNVATGRGALYSNTASNNTADGSQALNKNTTGTDNVAIGRTALFNNTTGSDNVAIGRGALGANNTASSNTATGYQALNKNTTGPDNTANGYQALFSNTTADSNTATGYQSLYHSTGIGNTANGVVTLYSNTTGAHNAALGDTALYENTTGSNNIAVGTSAGFFLTTGSSNIDIGHLGVNGESAAIRVGTVGTQTNTYVAGISGVTVAGGIGVIVDSSGHLGTSTSSARYKEHIQPMEKASEAILSLQPVTFHYKKELDPKGIPQFGLVAEQVEKVDPDLVARDEQGKPYSVRYEAVNAMLLNEFLKEHRKVEEQGATIAEQEEQIQALTASLK